MGVQMLRMWVRTSVLCVLCVQVHKCDVSCVCVMNVCEMCGVFACTQWVNSE